MSSSSNTNDSQWAFLSLIDFCKGFAITLIVFVHAVRGWFGWQGVHIFIVISGFMLAYSCLHKSSHRSWKHWYLKRAKRILPSYWLVVLINLFILSGYLILSKPGVFPNLTQAFHQFILDIFLLRNFNYKTMLGEPNSALWFIPLLCGLYLIFPVIYICLARAKKLGIVFTIATLFFGIEFGYRAVAIYCLDGMPVGYGHGFLRNFPLEIKPLQFLSKTFPFQGWAPFGFFPSRIGEFTLGILGAFYFAKHPKIFSKIICSSKVGLIAVLIWLVGNSLIYIHRSLWIFADFVIALSLTIWVVYLADLIQKKASFIFSGICFLGEWSYYIFLTHLSVGFISNQIYQNLYPEASYFFVFSIPVTITVIVFWSYFLKKVDTSEFLNSMLQTTKLRS